MSETLSGRLIGRTPGSESGNPGSSPGPTVSPRSDPVDARIPDGFKAAPSVPSLRTAGTDEAEADAPDTVAADSAVVDAERDPSYRDDVQHGRSLAYAEYLEFVRRGRLSRWQETRG